MTSARRPREPWLRRQALPRDVLGHKVPGTLPMNLGSAKLVFSGQIRPDLASPLA